MQAGLPALDPRPVLKRSNGKLLNMQGGFLIRHSRLMALGIMLCALATLFAVEAKIAWFSPARSASAQISFDKARPADPPKVLPTRFWVPAAPAYDLAGMMALASAVLHLTATAKGMARPAAFNSRISAFPGFSAALFFRPPPVR
jgi:hypothetical protein